MRTKKVLVALAVVAGVGATTRSMAAPAARTVEIAVTEKGFEPAHIQVVKGEPVRLVVTRKTDDTCAKQIEIHDANVGGMMGGSGGMGGMMQDMPAIHGLLTHHGEIERSVEDIPNGVRTVTTSKDAKVASMIREHVWQMKRRMEQGQPIRQMDPLFVELFKNHQHIHMKIDDIPGGARVEETADEARVVPLVRQHARKAISEFVAQGMRRAMQPTPLPPGYVPSDGQGQAQAPRRHGCRCMGST